MTTHVGTTLGTGTSSLTFDVLLPTGSVVGDQVHVNVASERAGIPSLSMADLITGTSGDVAGSTWAYYKGYKKLVQADITAGKLTVNSSSGSTRRHVATLTVLRDAGTPVYSHGVAFNGVSTVSAITQPSVSASGAGMVLALVGATSRSAQAGTDSTAVWTRDFAIAAPYTEVAEAETIAAAVNAYALVATRTVSGAGTIAATEWTEAFSRPATSFQASTVFVPHLAQTDAPIVSAGADLTLEAGENFTLNGTYTDTDNNVTDQAWKLAGTTLTSGPTYVGTAPTTLTGTVQNFVYEVSDAGGNVVSDTVVVTTNPAPLRIKTPTGTLPGTELAYIPDTVNLPDPSRPQNVQVIDEGDGYVKIQWDLNIGDSTTQYRLRLDGAHFGAVDQDENTYIYDGLTNGQRYSFQVQARGPGGVQSGNSVAVYGTPNITTESLDDISPNLADGRRALQGSFDPSALTTTPVATFAPTLPLTGAVTPTMGNTDATRRPELITAQNDVKYLRFNSDNLEAVSVNTGTHQNVSGWTIHVLARMAPASNSGVRTCIIINNAANTARSYLGVTDRKLRGGGRITDAGANTNLLDTTTDLGDNLWHHLAASADLIAKTMSLYVDGLLVASAPWQAGVTATATSNTLSNGMSWGALNNNTEPFVGDMTDATVFAVTQTQSEIQRVGRTFTIPVDIEAPAAPATISGTEGDSGEAIIDWSDVINATSYQVINKANSAVVATTTAPISVATISGLTNGTAYTFAVRAVGPTGGVGAESTTVQVTPLAPVIVNPNVTPESIGLLKLHMTTTSLQGTGKVPSWTARVGGLTFTQATADKQPRLMTIDGRSAVKFGPETITNADATTSTVNTWLKTGTNSMGQNWNGLTMYALVWVPIEQSWVTHLAVIQGPSTQRFSTRLTQGRATIASKRLDSEGLKMSPGVADMRNGSWNFVQVVHDPTGKGRISINGVLDHETTLFTSGPMSNTASSLMTLAVVGAGDGEYGNFAMTDLMIYEGAHTVAKATEAMAAIGFTPPTAVTASFTATVGADLNAGGVLLDEYRCKLTMSTSATYQARSSYNLRQVWEFTGATFRVPFMDPGQHIFQVRQKQADGRWSQWKTTAAYTARAWPNPTGDQLRWKMPAAWGVTYPITTIQLSGTQESLKITANGHYRIIPPAGGINTSNRFDLSISAPDESLILWDGGEMKATTASSINFKTRATSPTAWVYQQMLGVAFTGNNEGDTIQLSWNEVRDGTFVVENCSGARIYGGAGIGEHSDTQQLYAGPNTWKCDRWDAASDYQGYILYPQQINGFLDRNGGYITSWPMSRIRIHMATHTYTNPTTGVTSNTTGTPYYSWHDRLTGAPWPVYDKTPGSMKGIWTTRDVKNPNGNISCWFMKLSNMEAAFGNVTPGYWDGVQTLPQGQNPPESICLIGTNSAPGKNFLSSAVTYAAVPA